MSRRVVALLNAAKRTPSSCTIHHKHHHTDAFGKTTALLVAEGWESTTILCSPQSSTLPHSSKASIIPASSSSAPALTPTKSVTNCMRRVPSSEPDIVHGVRIRCGGSTRQQWSHVGHYHCNEQRRAVATTSHNKNNNEQTSSAESTTTAEATTTTDPEKVGGVTTASTIEAGEIVVEVEEDVRIEEKSDGFLEKDQKEKKGGEKGSISQEKEIGREDEEDVEATISRMSPEELEAKRAEEQLERLRLFQQQAAAIFQEQQQQQRQQQKQEQEELREQGGNSKNGGDYGSPEDTSIGPNPSNNAPTSTDSSHSPSNNNHNNTTTPSPRYSRRFTYVSEADRHKAATAGSTVKFDTPSTQPHQAEPTTRPPRPHTEGIDNDVSSTTTTTANSNTNDCANMEQSGSLNNNDKVNWDTSQTHDDVNGNATNTTSSSDDAVGDDTNSVTVEVLHPDMVIWETYVEHTDGTKGYVNIIANGAFMSTGGGGGDSGGGGGTGGVGSDGSGGAFVHEDGKNSKPAADIIGGAHFADIAAVDPFSKGKVLNYINRHKDQLPSSSIGRRTGKFFEVEEKEIKLGKSALAAAAGNSWAGAGTSHLNNLFGEPDSVFIYRAKLHVPLPTPHSSYVCEGMAESEKDAECLAAMHAERVIDALGVPLYRLPSAQTNHAEAARKAGRPAPLPGDPIAPEGHPTPMPLRMISSQISEAILRKYGESEDSLEARGASSSQKNGGRHEAGSKSNLSSFHEYFSLGGACREAEIIAPATSSSLDASASSPSANGFGSENGGKIITNAECAAAAGGGDVSNVKLSQLPELGLTSRELYKAQHAAKYKAGAFTSAAKNSPDLSPNSPCDPSQLSSTTPAEGPTSNTATERTAASPEQSPPAPISPYSLTGTTSAFTPPPGEPHNPADELYQTFHYPWRDGVNVDDTVDPNASIDQIYQREQALKDQQLRANANRMGYGNTAPTANKFDPTENGTYQITNITSVRFSPSDDSLQLAAIFDIKCVDRVKEWMQVTQNVFDFRTRMTASQVAVVGFASRMFVVELVIDEKEPSLIARGKAVDKDVAVALAAMHAELLIDATGRHLFPKNPTRQAKHSAEVQGYGRWATHPSRPNEKPPTDHLPLPLKQQLGQDDVLLDATTSRSLRTPEERLLAAHNEIYNTVYDFIEVNPDPADCRNAREIMRRWHREVARSRIDDLYVCTRMGDYFRASCVIPVPPQFGTRGGNAIGRSSEQAMDLCALHCLDVLCSLNIPVFRNPTEQANFVAERKRNGHIVPNEAQGIIKPPSHGKRVFIPYTPGYLVEGDKLKPLPPVNDLSYVLGLAKNYEKEFILPVKQQSNEKEILEHGNEARMNVQMYCRRTAGIVDQVPNVFITGYAKGMSVFNVAYLSLMIEKSICHKMGVARSFPAPLSEGLEKLCASNSSSPSSVSQEEASSQNTQGSSDEFKPLSPAEDRAFQRVVGDPIEGYYRFLAVGASLKKSDAIRMCFLHANELLTNFGIDLTQEKSRFMMSKRSGAPHPPQRKMPTPPSSTPPATTPTAQPSSSASATPTPQFSSANMKPIRPRRLQSVAAPAAGVTTMTMPNPSTPPTATRPSRLQQVAPPVVGGGTSGNISKNNVTANNNNNNSGNGMAQSVARSANGIAGSTASPTSSQPRQQQQQQQPASTPATTQSAAVTEPGKTSVTTASSAPSPSSSVVIDDGSPSKTPDPTKPPQLVPRPFFHPLMRNFFANAKLERAQQRRMQNAKSVGFR